MEKADYGKISTSYNCHRFLSESNMTRWVDLILRYSKAKKNDQVLDLGCGTGRFALPIAGQLGCQVTGADLSKEMLDKAKEKDKDQLVTWAHIDAGSLKYHNNSFDIIFMSHLLHHVVRF
jgi:ubiquinone/menaquinone biosynthesis C-methylase UbiE